MHTTFTIRQVSNLDFLIEGTNPTSGGKSVFNVPKPPVNRINGAIWGRKLSMAEARMWCDWLNRCHEFGLLDWSKPSYPRWIDENKIPPYPEMDGKPSYDKLLQIRDKYFEQCNSLNHMWSLIPPELANRSGNLENAVTEMVRTLYGNWEVDDEQR